MCERDFPTPHGPKANYPKVFITHAKAPNWSIQLNIFSTLAEQVQFLNLRTLDANPKRPAHPNYHLKINYLENEVHSFQDADH